MQFYNRSQELVSLEKYLMPRSLHIIHHTDNLIKEHINKLTQATAVNMTLVILWKVDI